MKKLLLPLFFIHTLSFANPTYDTAQGALQNSSALCNYGYNPNCSSDGNEYRERHIIINNITLPSKYGAMAESPKTGNTASSANANSLKEAKRRALSNCETIKGNGKCRIISTLRNGCYSMFEGKLKKGYRIFIKSSGIRNQAESIALNKCQKSGATGCRILMPEECSLPETPD